MDGDRKIGRALPPPPGPSPDAAAALARLEALIDGLLHPELGCPWDRSQTTRTITEDLLEEVYELRQGLLEDSGPSVLEEAGDVAFLMVFLARLTGARFGFGLAAMLDAATDKMVSRHPHVFGDVAISDDLDAFFKLWHKLKRSSKPQSGVLASVPTALPALTRCHRLAQKAGRSGFDFPSVGEVRRVLDAELAELDAELAADDLGTPAGSDRLAHEIGDVLATVANLARLSGLSAEKALDAYNRRFIGRFQHMEARLAERGLAPEEASAEELEDLWRQAKAAAAEAAAADVAGGGQVWTGREETGEAGEAGEAAAGAEADQGGPEEGPKKDFQEGFQAGQAGPQEGPRQDFQEGAQKGFQEGSQKGFQPGARAGSAAPKPAGKAGPS